MMIGIASDRASDIHSYLAAVSKSSHPMDIDDLVAAPMEIRHPSIAYRNVKLDIRLIAASASLPRNLPARSVFPNDEKVVPSSASTVGPKYLWNVCFIR